MSTWISGAITAIVVGGLVAWMGTTKPKVREDGHLVFRLNRPVFIVLLLLCGAVAAGAVLGFLWYLIHWNISQLVAMSPLAPIAMLFGAFAAMFIAALTTDMYDVYLGDEGITGASKVYGFGVRESRFTMPFSTMRKMGMTILQSVYVEDADGKRIYWSQYYSGHTMLEEEIARHLPQQD